MGVAPSSPARRVIRILECLGDHQQGGLTISKLAEELGLNRATCQSIVLALDEAGYVRRDRVTRAFSLGPAAISLGRAARGSLRIIDEVRPHVDGLADELHLECVAAMAAGDQMTIVASAVSASSFGVRLPVGLQVPFTPPFGSPFVAWSGEAAVDAWLDRAALSDTERARYREAVAAVQERGYSVTFEARSQIELGRMVDGLATPRIPAAARHEQSRLIGQLVHEEYLPTELQSGGRRIIQISAPVFGPDGTVALVLTVNGFRRDLSHDDIEWYAGRLMAAADKVMDRIHSDRPTSS